MCFLTLSHALALAYNLQANEEHGGVVVVASLCFQSSLQVLEQTR